MFVEGAMSGHRFSVSGLLDTLVCPTSIIQFFIPDFVQIRFYPRQKGLWNDVSSIVHVISLTSRFEVCVKSYTCNKFCREFFNRLEITILSLNAKFYASGWGLRIFYFFVEETLSCSKKKSCKSSRETTIIQSPIGRLAHNFIFMNLKGSLFRYKFKLFCSAHQAFLYEGLVFSSTLLLRAWAIFSFCPYPSFSAFWISLAFQKRL